MRHSRCADGTDRDLAGGTAAGTKDDFIRRGIGPHDIGCAIPEAGVAGVGIPTGTGTILGARSAKIGIIGDGRGMADTCEGNR